jgi:hypothetical protein
MKKNLNKIFSIFFLLCLFKIFYIGYFSSHFSFNILLNTFLPSNAENKSLSPYGDDLIVIKKYFKKKKINNYSIEDKILKNCGGLCQRIIEFNYPIKHINNSNYIISSKADKFFKCKEIIKTKNLILNECNKKL